MRRANATALLLVLLMLLGSLIGPAGAHLADARGRFEVVGHDPLMNRGMNAALAVHGDYAYVGSRTDGKAGNANNAGVFVVDISNPAKPEVVHEIGPPNEGNEGETSREMRIWPEQDVLIVMNLFSNCSELIHMCQPAPGDDNFRFYDISGKRAAAPKLVAEYVPSMNPHEFFLWQDPRNPKRALLFVSTPGDEAQMLVTDISRARDKKFAEVATWSSVAQDSLHSVALSPDGERAYLSHLTGGVLIADTSEVAQGKRKPAIRTITAPADAATWDGVDVHSAVPLFGKDYLLTTDEKYGDLLRVLGSGGCPWGWSHIVDISSERKPKTIAEYKLPQNDENFCRTDPPRPSSSYAAHNPTLTQNLAFVTWHAGGLQTIDISDPRKPRRAAEFFPNPLPFVFQEDPALSAGQDKVVMWSYPIIKDGLIYVVDVRNGLYILRYNGPFDDEVDRISFIEGNSNLGDVARLAR
ncbi:MAG: hypothetical protein M3238_06995 [Actinomycetota bacterium]|nr:hypothetical protein [Actinomycetota bacterium]